MSRLTTAIRFTRRHCSVPNPFWHFLWSKFIVSSISNQCLLITLNLHSFEKFYDPIPVLDWMRDHSLVPLFAVSAYCVLIFGGQYLMRDRQAWNWRRTMALWNLSLSLFSWIGMFRTLPQLLHNLYYMSVRDNLCLDPRATYGSGSSGLWVQLFILSKFP